jgi:hypothetical protein
MTRIRAARHAMLPSAVAFAIIIAVLVAPAAAQERSFVVHGSRNRCSDITQLDSVLTSGDRTYFAGWTERDYADALTWSDACCAGLDSNRDLCGSPSIPALAHRLDPFGQCGV